MGNKKKVILSLLLIGVILLLKQIEPSIHSNLDILFNIALVLILLSFSDQLILFVVSIFIWVSEIIILSLSKMNIFNRYISNYLSELLIIAIMVIFIGVISISLPYKIIF